jgi:hypothetical protein
VPAVSRVVAAVLLHRRCHLRCGDGRAHGRVPARDRLGEAQQVGLQVEVLRGENLAGTLEAAGDLVGDEPVYAIAA